MWHRIKPAVLLAASISSVLIGCAPSGSRLVFVTATPGGGNLPTGGGIAIPTAEPLDPTTAPTPVFLPTPNPTRSTVINPAVDAMHIVQVGESLSLIAQSYGVTVDALAAANGIANQNVLFPGQALIVPQGVQLTGPSFKIVPDSEIVRGPSVRGFDVANYLEGTNSY
ncbi:MAG: LysM peptidoglycan-binding domain-containing protein, partial [Anaerolineae bacterium]|nr:LysM peptidoglycan-binding domain-containing protein [Anaerolineae bacterium]